MFGFTRLKTKLLFFSVIAELLMITIMSIYFFQTNKIINNGVKQNSDKLFKQVEGLINSNFNELRNTVKLYANSNTIQNYLTEKNELKKYENRQQIEDMFLNTKCIKSNVVDLFIVDSNKKFSTYGDKWYYYNSISNELTTDRSIKISNIIVEPNDHLDSQNINFYIQTAIYGKSINYFNEYLGNLIIIFNVDELDSIIKGLEVTKNSKIYIADSSFRIMSSSNYLEKGTKINDNLIEQISNFKNLQNKKVNGINYVINYKRIKPNDIYLISMIPEEELYGELNKAKIIGLAIILLMGLIQLIFIRTIIKSTVTPFRKILFSIRKIKEGNLGNRVKLKDKSEIGQLAGEFDEMMDNIAHLNNEIIEKHRDIYQMQLSKNEVEITSLENQMNPHFLYNTLACIRSIAICYDVKEIAQITKALAKICDYTIRTPEQVTIRQEIENIRYYLDIQQIRFNDRLKVSIKIDEEILDIKILKFILQPLVENAVEHGIVNNIEGGILQIECNRIDDKIEFLVIDNGIGIEKAQLNLLKNSLKTQSPFKKDNESRFSIGLQNVSKRLNLYYKGNSGLEIVSKEKLGTNIRIWVKI